MDKMCIFCKGRLWCGRKYCPIQAKISAQKKQVREFKQEYQGSSPNIFVGRADYPNVRVGVLSTEFYNHNDEPKLWSKTNYSINKIIDLRTQLIDSFSKTYKLNGSFFQSIQEIAMAKKPTDVEVKLDKKPDFKLSFNQDVAPFGPSVGLERFKVTENPKIPTAVEKVYSDYDFKANDALSYLSKKGFDEYYLTKLLSAATLGRKTSRKVVPTRWAITATDSNLGNQILKEIQDFETLESFSFYFGGHYGNYYICLLMPGVFRYELFEIVANGKGKSLDYVTDYESSFGRKDYADITAGGYYAARLSAVRKLKQIKRRASVLLLRFITDEYWAPLGVWVVREAVKKSFDSNPLRFSSLNLMLDYAVKFTKMKFGLEIEPLILKSKLIKEIRSQKKLSDFR